MQGDGDFANESPPDFAVEEPSPDLAVEESKPNLTADESPPRLAVNLSAASEDTPPLVLNAEPRPPGIIRATPPVWARVGAPPLIQSPAMHVSAMSPSGTDASMTPKLGLGADGDPGDSTEAIASRTEGTVGTPEGRSTRSKGHRIMFSESEVGDSSPDQGPTPPAVVPSPMAPPAPARPGREGKFLDRFPTLRAFRTVHRVILSFRDLAADVPAHHTGGTVRIMHPATGSFQPESLTAIMGSSGAGKSTFLNLIAGRQPRGAIVSGTVAVNGKAAGSDADLIAFVKQHDLLHTALTVKETLLFCAELRLPPTVTAKEKLDRVHGIISTMCLDKVMDTLVGGGDRLGSSPGISKGEKRRLTVSLELVTLPSLILLDEPTSSLDSYNALLLTQALHSMANDGRTLIASIHQPRGDIFVLFTHVLLMSHGYMVYHGRRTKLVEYWSKLGFEITGQGNMADVVMDLLAGSSKKSGNSNASGKDGAGSNNGSTHSIAMGMNAKDVFHPSSEITVTSTPMTSAGVPLCQETNTLRLAKGLAAAYESSDIGRKAIAAAADLSSPEAAERVMAAQRKGRRMSRNASMGLTDKNGRYATSRLSQFFTLTRRFLLIFSRNPMEYVSLVLQGCILGAVIGVVFTDLGVDDVATPRQIVSLAFYHIFIMINVLGSTIHVVPTMMEHRIVFDEERDAGMYSVFPYWLAQTFTSALPLALVCGLGLIVSYFAVPVSHAAGHFFFTYFTLYLVMHAGHSKILNVIWLIRREGVCMAIANVIIITSIWFAGIIILIDQIPPYLRWIVWVNEIQYGFNALNWNELGIDNTFANILFDQDRYKTRWVPIWRMACIVVFWRLTVFLFMWKANAVVAGFMYIVRRIRSMKRPWAKRPAASEPSYYEGPENGGAAGGGTQHDRDDTNHASDLVATPYSPFSDPAARRAAASTSGRGSNAGGSKGAKERDLRMAVMMQSVVPVTPRTPGAAEGGLDGVSPFTGETPSHTPRTGKQKKVKRGTTLQRAAPVNLVFLQLTYDVSTAKVKLPWRHHSGAKRRILHPMSGMFLPSRMTCILGESGSGKSTLLNVLAGRYMPGTLGGRVLYNGAPMNRQLRMMTAYVKQDDFLLPSLTVWETVMFHAILRLPSTMERKELEGRVDNILRTLLLRRVSATKVGSALIPGLSSGEKRRLSVALDVVTLPSLVLLDEPTSGLDSHNALVLVRVLHHMSGDGRTILTTIHQPRQDIFNMFDHVLLVAEGKLLYQGRGSDVVAYFGSCGYICSPGTNPADFLLDTLAGLPTEADLGNAGTLDEVMDLAVELRRQVIETLSNKYNAREQARYQALEAELGYRTFKPANAALSAAELEHTLTGMAANADDDRFVRMPFTSRVWHFLRGTDVTVGRDAGDSARGSGAASPPPPLSARVRHLVKGGVREQKYTASWFKEVWVLTRRFMYTAVRDPTEYMLIVVFCTGFAIVYALMMSNIRTLNTQGDTLGFIRLTFTRCSYLGFSSLFLSYLPMNNMDTMSHYLTVFLEERERRMYRTSSFYIAQGFTMLVAVLGYVFLFLIISYFAVGLETKHFGFVLLVMWINTYTMASFDFTLAMFGNLELATALCNLVTIGNMLFSGYVLQMEFLPSWLQWAYYAAFQQYTFSALVIHEFAKNNFLRLLFPFPYEYKGSAHRDGDPQMYWKLFGYLVLVMACYRVLSYLYLRFISRSRVNPAMDRPPPAHRKNPQGKAWIEFSDSQNVTPSYSPIYDAQSPSAVASIEAIGVSMNDRRTPFRGA
eukprot:jgi/Mesvir1/6191/Mv00877-RA.1